MVRVHLDDVLIGLKKIVGNRFAIILTCKPIHWLHLGNFYGHHVHQNLGAKVYEKDPVCVSCFCWHASFFSTFLIRVNTIIFFKIIELELLYQKHFHDDFSNRLEACLSVLVICSSSAWKDSCRICRRLGDNAALSPCNVGPRPNPVSTQGNGHELLWAWEAEDGGLYLDIYLSHFRWSHSFYFPLKNPH